MRGCGMPRHPSGGSRRRPLGWAPAARSPHPLLEEIPLNVVTFIIAMAFFVFGMLLMGYAPGLPGLEAVVFFGGILSVAIAVAIPVNILGRGDGV